MIIGTWELYTVLAIVLVAGGWIGWFISDSQYKTRERRRQEAVDRVIGERPALSPKPLPASPVPTPNDWCVATDHHLHSIDAGERYWDCGCEPCVLVRATLIERMVLPKWEHQIRMAHRRWTNGHQKMVQKPVPLVDCE